MSAKPTRPVSPTALPRDFEPQLATLVKSAPQGDEWLHELKYDGYRIGCRVDGHEVRLLSRRGKDWTAQFPELVAAARKLKAKQALLDGEVAVVLEDGRTSFQALQNYFGGQQRTGLVYFAFDLLHLDGEDLAARPLDQRKAALERLLHDGDKGIIRYSAHVIGNGPAFFEQARRMGVEGIISKRRDQPYRAGRTAGWLKIKCIKRQELVIGGFTEPEGSRDGIGALLLGVHDAAGRLAFAGKVGTGFSQKVALELRKRLEALVQSTSPFQPPPTGPERHAHWVKPTLVAEVSFSEWTTDGKVRQASFQGLREDKLARDVVAELPVETSEITAADGGHSDKGTAPIVARRGISGGGAPPTADGGGRRHLHSSHTRQPQAAPTRTKKRGERVDVAGISISHPERVLYPSVGVTKLDLARYYESIEASILPHVVGRPLTLVRCPKGLVEGDAEACFYMKHSSVWAPPALRRVHIKEKTKRGEYLVIEDLAGIISLAQMDVLEIHTWNSPSDDVERPNRVVFDLDPGPDITWREVIEAARVVREALSSLQLESFVKNTGGRGLHVVVPIAPGPSWDDCLMFTRNLSAAIVRSHPSRYTISVPKAGREKKILIDYLRNNRGNTSIAAFSSRARETAPVSVTLSWEELSPRIPPNHFTVATLPKRLASLRRDPWEAYWRCRQRLAPALLEAVAQLR